MTAQITSASAAQQTTLALGAYIADAPAIVMWYQDWVHPGNSAFDRMKMDAVVAHGAMPMITWEPWDATGGPHQPAFAPSTIIAGAHDAFIRDWARAAAGWNKPLYLKFAHEMNGNWYPWAVGVDGVTGK